MLYDISRRKKNLYSLIVYQRKIYWCWWEHKIWKQVALSTKLRSYSITSSKRILLHDISKSFAYMIYSNTVTTNPGSRMTLASSKSLMKFNSQRTFNRLRTRKRQYQTTRLSYWVSIDWFKKNCNDFMECDTMNSWMGSSVCWRNDTKPITSNQPDIC